MNMKEYSFLSIFLKLQICCPKIAKQALPLLVILTYPLKQKKDRIYRVRTKAPFGRREWNGMKRIFLEHSSLPLVWEF